jgi:hypothetical protein
MTEGRRMSVAIGMPLSVVCGKIEGSKQKFENRCWPNKFFTHCDSPKSPGHYDAKADFALSKLCRKVFQSSLFEVPDNMHDRRWNSV